MIKVLFICHGNICRSTMAESVFTHLVKQHHIDHLFEINSAATSREEIGNTPHYGTVNKLRQVGIPVIPHRAVQMTPQDYEYYDYLIGMEGINIRYMNRITGGDPDGKFFKMMEFAGDGWKELMAGKRNMERAGDVADPWYTGDFGVTWRDVSAGCEGLLEYLLAQEN